MNDEPQNNPIESQLLIAKEAKTSAQTQAPAWDQCAKTSQDAPKWSLCAKVSIFDGCWLRFGAMLAPFRFQNLPQMEKQNRPKSDNVKIWNKYEKRPLQEKRKWPRNRHFEYRPALGTSKNAIREGFQEKHEKFMDFGSKKERFWKAENLLKC